MTTANSDRIPDPLHVLVVCTGNICRSPMGEIVLRAKLEEAGLDDHVVITSAGISDEEVGNPIDPRAKEVLEGAGYVVHRHEPHRVAPDELGAQQLVLAMTSRHEDYLRRQAEREQVALRTGEDVDALVTPGTTTLRMWREFDPAAPTEPRRRSELDAPDPWYGGMEDFRETLETVERGAETLVEKIAEQLR